MSVSLRASSLQLGSWEDYRHGGYGDTVFKIQTPILFLIDSGTG